MRMKETELMWVYMKYMFPYISHMHIYIQTITFVLFSLAQPSQFCYAALLVLPCF